MATTPLPGEHHFDDRGSAPQGSSLSRPNSELVVVIVALAIVGVIALTSDALSTAAAGVFVASTVFITFAYLLSRGIAKRGNARDG